jgi:hypothetical protein
MNVDAGAMTGAANAEPDPSADEIVAGREP